MDCTVNAVQTHIEHFIDSNPLLASTSCTDPVNNLKHPLKQIRVKTPPRIVLNLTVEPDIQHQKSIRSRSHSPFWIKDKSSSYSEVVKTGHASRNNSRSPSPESMQVKERASRKSTFRLLQKPSVRARSKSPKEKWLQNNPEKVQRHTLIHDSSTSLPKKSSLVTDENLRNNLNLTTEPNNSKHVKRRSRSRRSRSTKHNFENKLLVDDDKNVDETIVSSKADSVKQNKDKPVSINPEIIVSDVKNQLPHDCNNVKFQDSKTPLNIVETCSQTYGLVDESFNAPDQKCSTTNATVSLITAANSSLNPRLSLTSVPGIEYLDSCFDLNERLMGIFGSVDKKHYRQRVFDRPRSKSDTRDLNELSQIFTHNPITDDKYLCRFERSAGSVKNNYPNRDSTSGRRSFDNILSSFGNMQMGMSDYTADYNSSKSVRPSVEI